MSQESEQAQEAWMNEAERLLWKGNEPDRHEIYQFLDDYKAALKAEIESQMSDFGEEMNESEAVGYATLMIVLSLLDTVIPIKNG